MLITTKRRSHATLRAFSLVMGLCLGLLTAGVAFALGGVMWPAWGVAAMFGAAAVGWWNRGVAERGLETWNTLARAVARLARLALTGAAFLVIVLAGAAGSELPWRPARPGASGWLPRGDEGKRAFESQSNLASRGGNWVRTVAAWARGSRNVWVWALIPPLLLLSRIQLSNQRSLGGATYTLY
jgi:hypothetical protein